jgi:DNA-binding transcriptional ArsR family regulator
VTIVDEDLSLTFAALADPTRRAILSRLAGGEATVNQLAEPFAMTQQAISKHIKILERAGLISRTRAAQRRPCQLETGHLDAAAEWIGRHRRLWEERYDRLDEHLATLRRPSQPDTSQSHPDPTHPDPTHPDPTQQDPTQQGPTQQDPTQQDPTQQERPV